MRLGLYVQEACFAPPSLSPVLGLQSFACGSGSSGSAFHFPRSDEHSVEVQSRSHGSRRAGRRALRSVGRSPTWSPSSSSSDTGGPAAGWEAWPRRVQGGRSAHSSTAPWFILRGFPHVRGPVPDFPAMGTPYPTPGQSSEAEMQWRLQVNRLQELIDQLECKVSDHKASAPRGRTFLESI